MNLNFVKELAPLVKSGRKVHTIRLGYRWAIGMKVHLFAGLRTRDCKRLGEGACKRIDSVEIWPWEHRLLLNGLALEGAGLERLARNDGFSNAAGLFNFFRVHYPKQFKLNGQLIWWVEGWDYHNLNP